MIIRVKKLVRRRSRNVSQFALREIPRLNTTDECGNMCDEIYLLFQYVKKLIY